MSPISKVETGEMHDPNGVLPILRRGLSSDELASLDINPAFFSRIDAENIVSMIRRKAGEVPRN